jgi:cytochrome c oxidase subunit 2
MTLLALISTRHEYDSLFSVYVPIAGAVFVIVLIVVLAAVVRFRARPPEAAASWAENNPLEISYAVLLTAIVAFLLYLTYSAEHKVDTVSQRQRPVATVDVTSAKWEWEFSYPGYGINHYSGTVLRQPLVVPVNQPVAFNMRALDVIHAFWVPLIEYKHDIFPGHPVHLILVFPKAGLYRAQCAQFCGLRHADMVFNVRVVSPSAFSAWERSGGRMSLS